MLTRTLLPTLLLLGSFDLTLSTALPRATLSAQSIIESIMPTSTSCASASASASTSECRTAAQAAPYFIAAFQTYNLSTAAEMAAVLALSGYESADLKYKHNVSPGRPGQGTSNMQMLAYNQLYAADLFGSASVPSDADAVLATVTPDEYNFGSGAWFLSTQCGSAQGVLRTDAESGWTEYMACVGVSATEERTAYWMRAKSAFGLV